MANLTNYIQNNTAQEVVATNPFPQVGVETLTNKRQPVTGKPIYTQTFTGTSPNSETDNDFTISTGLTGVDFASIVDVVHWDSINNQIRGNLSSYAINDSSESRFFVSNNGATIDVRLGIASFDKNANFEITLEYTKTSDTSGSPIASTTFTGAVLGYDETSTSAVTSTTANISNDDTVPGPTEGAQLLSITYTPKKVGSKLKINSNVYVVANVAGQTSISTLVVGGSTVQATRQSISNETDQSSSSIEHTYTTTSLSPITIAVRYGAGSGTCYANSNTTGTRKLGGSVKSTLSVMEMDI